MRVAGLVAATCLFLAGCQVGPAATIPARVLDLDPRLAEMGGSFEIDVAPEFRDRVPDRDSSLRRYRPYPE
jgi:hypothetical protein